MRLNQSIAPPSTRRDLVVGLGFALANAAAHLGWHVWDRYGAVLASTFVLTVLLVVWLYVLNDKIQKGPQAVHAAGQTTAAGVLDVGGGRAQHRDSMSEAKSPDGEEG